MTLPKTIQIFLPDGNPRGIRIAAITSRTVQAIQIPRSSLHEAQARQEPHNVGVYFLFGESEESTKPVVYIGEAEDCYHRVKQHNQSKDFWNTAVVITSKIQSFTKAHIKYLEWYCYDQTKQTGRYRLENTSIPTKSYVPEPIIADLLDNFETMRVLLATLGFPIFEAVAEARARQTLYYCQGRGAEGRGVYVEDGFLILAGSQAAKTLTKSAQASWIKNLREGLLADGILVTGDKTLTFAEDYLFKSPSGAAATLLGRHTNGWIAWKTQAGRTLDELERQPQITDSNEQ